MSTDLPGTAHRGMTWPQLLSMVIGAVYTLVGIAGFFVTGFDDWTGRTHEHLLGFGVDPIHNVVHLAIGLAGLALARTLAGGPTHGLALPGGVRGRVLPGPLRGDPTWGFPEINLG